MTAKMTWASFWARVRQGPTSDCWPWVGTFNRSGYGRVHRWGRQEQTHRVAYELAVGPIEPGMEIDHLCRNRACCNPAHMEVVTHRENTMRGQTIVAAAAARTHCPRGHPYDEVNTYFHPSCGRMCRTCQREHKRAYKRRKRLEREAGRR